MDKRHGNKWVLALLAVIILIALTIRSVFFIYNIQNFKTPGDSKNYINMSRQLVDKGIYGYWYEGYSYGGKPGVSNARVTPGYPLFLSGVYAVFHDPYTHITAIRGIQVIIGGFITPLLAFLFARRLTKRNSIGLLTAFSTAVYPTYILSTTQILTEVLALASLLLYFYLATVGFQSRKWLMNLLAGAAFGIQILIRPNVLPLFVIPFIFGWFTWFKDNRRQLINIFLVTLIGFVVVMSPWWIRNYAVLGEIVLTADGAGNPLLYGTYPYRINEGYDVPDNIRGISKLQMEFAKKRIIKGFTSEPFYYLKWYTIGKIQHLFKLPWLPGVSKLDPIYLIAHYCILLCGFAGGIIAFIKSRTGRLLCIYGGLYLGMCLVFIPENRYVYQIMFLMMLGAAYALLVICSKVRAIIVNRG